MKRGQIKPRDWIISGGVLILIIAVGTQFIYAANTEQNIISPTDQKFENFNNTLNKHGEYALQADALDSKVEGITASGNNPLDFLNNLFNNGWNIIRSIGNSFGFLKDMLGVLASVFGLPPFIGATITAMIAVIFGLGLAAVIFNRDF